MILSVLIFAIILFLPGVRCWKELPPTSFLTNDGTMMRTMITPAPIPTQANFRRSGSAPCAQLSGDASVSNYIFNCPSDQTCAVLLSGYRADRATTNNWGCCKLVPVPGCVSLYCPTYSSCINSTALGSCNSDCIANTGLLKCTDPTKPFCATASAIITDSENTAISQYACADYPYTLTFTLLAAETADGFECAPPWVTNPASLAAWSTSEASQLSYDMIQNFGDPFDQIVVSANFSTLTILPSTIASSSATTSPPIVQVPTTAAATRSSTTSTGTKGMVLSSSSLCFPFMLAVGHFLLS